MFEMCGYVAGEKSVRTKASIFFVKFGRRNEDDATYFANDWRARAWETATEYKGSIQGEEYQWTLLYA